MSRRRKRLPGRSNHERWLVSYADFITLLFAFFVVLYSSAQVDQKKVGKLALAIQIAFQEMGVFPASTTQVPLDLNEPMPFSTVQAIQNVAHNTELGRTLPPQKILWLRLPTRPISRPCKLNCRTLYTMKSGRIRWHCIAKPMGWW
jgi:hypothetical protein